jgi:large subunit ribosomal protein L32
MQIQYCPNCEQPVLPHRVCANCGFYQGREVIAQEKKEK